MLKSIAVTNPHQIAIDNRQTNNRQREKENRAAVIRWCIGKVCTCGCGKPANVAHHVSDELYKDETAYLDLANCDPYRAWCHRMHHKGFVRCPVCHGWMREGRDKCAKCSGWKKHKFIKSHHPCKSHLKSGRCSKSRIGSQCLYSPNKAPVLCKDGFVARVPR